MGLPSKNGFTNNILAFLMAREKQNARISPNAVQTQKKKKHHTDPSTNTQSPQNTESLSDKNPEKIKRQRTNKTNRITEKTQPNITSKDESADKENHQPNPANVKHKVADKKINIDNQRNESIVSFVPDTEDKSIKIVTSINLNKSEPVALTKSEPNGDSNDATKLLLHNQYVRRSKYWLFRASELNINFDKVEVDYCYWQFQGYYTGVIHFKNRQKFSAVKTVLGKDIVFEWIDDIRNNSMSLLLQNKSGQRWEYGSRPANLTTDGMEDVIPYNAESWITVENEKEIDKNERKKNNEKKDLKNDDVVLDVSTKVKKTKTKKIKEDAKTKRERFLKEVAVLSRLVLSGLNFVDIYLIEPVMARRHKDYLLEFLKNEGRKRRHEREQSKQK